MSKSSKRRYTTEFKQQAVALAERVGIAKAGEQLGLNPANIRRWKAKSSIQSQSSMIGLEEENRRLVRMRLRTAHVLSKVYSLMRA